MQKRFKRKNIRVYFGVLFIVLLCFILFILRSCQTQIENKFQVNGALTIASNVTSSATPTPMVSKIMPKKSGHVENNQSSMSDAEIQRIGKSWFLAKFQEHRIDVGRCVRDSILKDLDHLDFQVRWDSSFMLLELKIDNDLSEDLENKEGKLVLERCLFSVFSSFAGAPQVSRPSSAASVSRPILMKFSVWLRS